MLQDSPLQSSVVAGKGRATIRICRADRDGRISSGRRIANAYPYKQFEKLTGIKVRLEVLPED
ncbi:MAG TPA: hypothetical protein VGA51_12880 [Casimicrobiaceae bacterium]